MSSATAKAAVPSANNHYTMNGKRCSAKAKKNKISNPYHHYITEAESNIPASL